MVIYTRSQEGLYPLDEKGVMAAESRAIAERARTRAMLDARSPSPETSDPHPTPASETENLS